MIQIRRRTALIAVVALVLATASLILTLSRSAAAGDPGFSDTPPWIADQAQWLADNGIATGYPDFTFRPNDEITRGQSAFWLSNYNDAIELVTTQESSPGSSGTHFLEMVCPGDKRAVAGGGDSSAPGEEVLFMVHSFPPVPGKWWVTWKTADGTPTEPIYLSGWALCVPETVP